MLGFILFILVNATLFIRPAEIVPALLGLPIYEYLIVACLVVCLPSVLKQLTARSLAERPITLCVVGLLVAIVLSHLSHFNTYDARLGAILFAKIVVYYLLLMAVVNSPARLRWFLIWLAGFAVVLIVLALLQYHRVINIPSLTTLEELDIDDVTGEAVLIPRLRSTGIFNDPNDLSLLLLTGMAICLYLAGDRRFGLLRPLWLAPLGLFGYALALTKSRGGFIGLLAGMLVLFRARFGWARTIILAGVALPVMLVLFGGRQTQISSGISGHADTGQARIQLWSEGLQLFREAPLFGIGQGEYGERVGQVAHNSYVHSYTELGFFGGTLFVGAFYFALWTLHRIGSPPVRILDPELRRMRPYLMAIVTAYAAGILSLSRDYVVPTYMVLGLATAYIRLALVDPPLPMTRFNGRLARRFAAVSLVFLAGLYVFVRVFVHRGR